MADEITNNYDGKFEEIISVVGETGCGETTFVQNFGKNRMFEEIEEVMWLSLSKDRENNITESFVNEKMDFKYPNNVEEFDDLLEYFKEKKHFAAKII